MYLEELERYITNLFATSNNEHFDEESGFTVVPNKNIEKIGYCTNLTLDTVEEAKKNNVDLIITHHDAWEFMFGLKDACREKLRDYNISHYFNHLPLDDCDFGTNNSLLNELGLKIIEKNNKEKGFYCGRIAEFEEKITFDEFVQKLENLLQEPIDAWQFNNESIKRVGLVCGGGGLTTDVKLAVEKNCDVYITGEKILYTIEYAKFTQTNLIIGSHTFTEIFGVKSLVEKIKDEFTEVEIVRLKEEHLETRV